MRVVSCTTYLPLHAQPELRTACTWLVQLARTRRPVRQDHAEAAAAMRCGTLLLVAAWARGGPLSYACLLFAELGLPPRLRYLYGPPQDVLNTARVCLVAMVFDGVRHLLFDN